MADVILAGAKDEKFGGIGNMLKDSGLSVDRIEMEITDPEFQALDANCEIGVVVSRFHEGDLASIKAMQSLKLKVQCMSFIFISEKELPASVLTLLFNEGAYGILNEPVSMESAKRLISQAVKKSAWERDEIIRRENLAKSNEILQNKIESLEYELSISVKFGEKLERLVYSLIKDNEVKPESIKILIVSDSQYQRNVLTGQFSDIGFQVESTGSAEDAMPEIKKIKPKIVLSDLELPKMSGVDLAREVKGTKGYPPLHFVIVTSSEDKLDYILSPETMVDDCVIKPGKSEQYYGLVAKVALGLLTV